MYHTLFRNHSSRTCTFFRSLRIDDEGACVAGHREWVRRSRPAADLLVLGRVQPAQHLDLLVLVAAGSAVVVLVGPSRQGGLDTDLAPCEEAGCIPIQVGSPCAEAVVLGTVTYLGLAEGAANSTVDRSGSAVVQWKGLWERRCQILLHLRLMRDAHHLHRFSGTQTDLMVVPCFLPHRVVLENTGDNAPNIRLDIAQMAVRHRSQTAVCWCLRIVGRSAECRSRQMNALLMFSQKLLCND